MSGGFSIHILRKTTHEIMRMKLSELIFGRVDDPQKTQITENLLRGVWGFDLPHDVAKAKAASCFYHYESLLSNRQLLDDANTSLRDSDTQSTDVINLIAFLKTKTQTSIADIRNSLQQAPPAWLLNPGSPVVQDKVFSFAVRLWLFTKPDLTGGNDTLQEAVQKTLNGINSKPQTQYIWLDFSADTLTRRAGFHIMWTSDLSEHLTFASRSVIRVFSHASVLERYEKATEG
jgi:hypothetical protein